MVQEQAEAEEDTSLQQRLLMGAGTTLEGASEMTDNEIASGEPSTGLQYETTEMCTPVKECGVLGAWCKGQWMKN